MRKSSGLAALCAGVFAASALANEKNPTFVPVPTEVSETQSVSTPHGLGVGFYLNTLLPTSEPFRSQLNGSADFRYQNATGAGTEFTYTTGPSFEFGLNAGYEQYSTRAQVGSSTLLEFQKLKYWQVPVLLFVRYKMNNDDISPEIEAGAGYGYGKIKIGSTNLGAKPVSDTLTSYRAYASAGAGLAWTESSSIHASVGYAYYKFPDKNYSNTLIAVSQSAAGGIFAKTTLRYKF